MSRLPPSVAAAVALLAVGCSVLAGVNFGDTHPAEIDQGIDGSITQPETGAPAGDDGGPIGVVDGSIEASSCTPDPNSVTCKGRCGDVLDNCGSTRHCSTDCGLGQACMGGMCQCVSQPGWCDNRCGPSTDNCNQPVPCGGCDGGLTCVQSACGCVPDPPATTCTGKQCGTATNNCGQSVACGKSGACVDGAAICEANGTCCVDDGSACANRCGGVSVTNNCGKQVGCPQQCNAGQVCTGTSCCTPDPLATTCAGKPCGMATNNCGQVVLCPNTCVAPNTCGGGGAGPNGCGCTSTGNPCGDRCRGQVADNCGTMFTCSASCGLDGVCSCAGGTCQSSGFCSCKPPPCL